MTTLQLAGSVLCCVDTLLQVAFASELKKFQNSTEALNEDRNVIFFAFYTSAFNVFLMFIDTLYQSRYFKLGMWEDYLVCEWDGLRR